MPMFFYWEKMVREKVYWPWPCTGFHNAIKIPLSLWIWAAISHSLFESELFGHKKGAFTDAQEDKAGRFETAHEGTLFLDEIGNLDMALQSKLLTVFQNRKVMRLGETRERHIDVRLVCATNMPIHQMVQEGGFRQDLLYRINTVELEVPPLREAHGRHPHIGQALFGEICT